jgi:hypothetical protein
MVVHLVIVTGWTAPWIIISRRLNTGILGGEPGRCCHRCARGSSRKVARVGGAGLLVLDADRDIARLGFEHLCSNVDQAVRA